MNSCFSIYSNSEIIQHKTMILTHYSFNDYNIFGRKSRTSYSEVKSKGYPEFEQPVRARFERYPL